MRTLFSLIVFLSIYLSASADIRLPSLFGDHMILQQDSSNTIWGWADAGEKVTVKASWGATTTTTADDDGKWRLRRVVLSRD